MDDTLIIVSRFVGTPSFESVSECFFFLYTKKKKNTAIQIATTTQIGATMSTVSDAFFVSKLAPASSKVTGAATGVRVGASVPMLASPPIYLSCDLNCRFYVD